MLVTIDTLRPDRLGAYGYAPARTPNLDALASRGVRFVNAVTASVWTGPSHAAMITHRNWALPTAGFLTLLALWRFMKRAEKPGILFAALFLLAAASLSVTAWWGGRLVFVHGLGVQSMPASTGFSLRSLSAKLWMVPI